MKTGLNSARSDEWAGVALALVSAVASGSLGILGKAAASLGMGTPTLLSWRFGLTAALLFALGAGRVGRGERVRLLVVGAMYAMSTVAYFTALGRVSAGTAGLLVYVAPAFVVLYGALLGTRPTVGQVGALVLALAGLGVVVGLPGAADADALGLAAGGAAGALYGGFVFASGRLAAGSAPLTVTAHVALVCALTFAALGFAHGTPGVPSGAAQWTVVVAMIVAPTLVAIPALLGAVRRIGGTRASLLATTDPLWTLLFAALFLGEGVGASQLLGGALILSGSALAQIGGGTRRD